MNGCDAWEGLKKGQIVTVGGHPVKVSKGKMWEQCPETGEWYMMALSEILTRTDFEVA